MVQLVADLKCMFNVYYKIVEHGKQEVDMERLAHIRQEYLPDLPVSLFGNIVDKLLNYRPLGKPTAYDLLNSSTNVLWHKKKSTKAKRS